MSQSTISKLSNVDREKLAQTALKAQIKKIKQAPPDSQIVKANQHLLESDAESINFGIGVGELSCAGVIFYGLDCSLLVAGTYACTVSFNATGVSWDIGAFTSQVAGAFLVNPKNIAGACKFTCIDADVIEGGVVFSLFSKDGTLYGTFIGDTEGADVADISGSGTLSVAE